MNNLKIIFAFIYFFLLYVSSNCFAQEVYNISLYEDDPPYSYTDQNSTPRGYLVDYWKLWAKNSGKNVKLILSKRSDATSLVSSGFADLCGALAQTSENSDSFEFSKPIFESKTCLIAKKYLTNSGSLDNLTKESLAVIKESLPHLYLQRYYPHLKLLFYKNRFEMSKELIKNKIEYAIIDIHNNENIEISIPGIVNYNLLETIYMSKIRAAVKKGNTNLLKEINDGITKINITEIDNITDIWITQKQKNKNRYYYILILYSIIFVIITTIILFYFYKLRLKKIKEQFLSDKNELLSKIYFQNNEINKNELELGKIKNELENQKNLYEQTNKTTIETVKKYENEIQTLKSKITSNIENNILPILNSLNSSDVNNVKKFIDILKKTLSEICLREGIIITDPENALTNRETEICNYIEKDLSNKEIANLLNITVKAVEKHRENIRKKLKITNQSENLKEYLKKTSKKNTNIENK